MKNTIQWEIMFTLTFFFFVSLLIRELMIPIISKPRITTNKLLNRLYTFLQYSTFWKPPKLPWLPNWSGSFPPMSRTCWWNIFINWCRYLKDNKVVGYCWRGSLTWWQWQEMVQLYVTWMIEEPFEFFQWWLEIN